MKIEKGHNNKDIVGENFHQSDTCLKKKIVKKNLIYQLDRNSDREDRNTFIIH